MRGFTNIFRREFSVVNIDGLSGISDNSEVTPQGMVDMGLIKNLNKPVKILGRGDLSVSLRIQAHRFSSAARTKIEAAGGKTKEIE